MRTVPFCHGRSPVMTPLRQRMVEDHATAERFTANLVPLSHCVARFAQYFRTSPAIALAPNTSAQYQLFLVQEKHVSWSLGHADGLWTAVFLPGDLGTPDDARLYPAPHAAVNAADDPQSSRSRGPARRSPRTQKHRALLTTLYATGLRVAELCHWQVTEIDSARLVVRVRQGKGHHDRYVMLSTKFLPFLRQYWQREKPRPWLFPGHARTRPMARERCISSAGRPGRQRPCQRLCIHICWRPAFATHLFAAGVDVRRLQLLAWAIRACGPPAALSM